MQKAKFWCCLLLCSVSSIVSAASVTVHYQRTNSDYDNWGLHIWAGEVVVNGKEVGARTDFRLRKGTSPTDPLLPTKFDDFGVSFTIPVRKDATQFSYAVTNGEAFHANQDEWKWQQAKHGNEIWIVEGKTQVFTSNPKVASYASQNNSNRAKAAATPPPPPPSKTVAKQEVKKAAKPVAKPKPAPKKTVAKAAPAVDSRALKVLEKELNTKQRTINQLQTALNNAQSINRRLQSQVNEKFMEYQELLQQNDKLQSENRQLTASNQSLYQQAQQANTSDAEQQLMTRTQDLENEISLRNSDIADLRNQLAKASTDQTNQDQLTQQMKQIQEQRDGLQAQNDKLSAHVLDLVERSDSPQQPSSGIAWWIFAIAIACLVLLAVAIAVIFNRKMKVLSEHSEDMLRRKEDEIKTEKIYAAAANEKLRKVLHGEAQQRSWQATSLPENFPENMKKDAV